MAIWPTKLMAASLLTLTLLFLFILILIFITAIKIYIRQLFYLYTIEQSDKLFKYKDVLLFLKVKKWLFWVVSIHFIVLLPHGLVDFSFAYCSEVIWVRGFWPQNTQAYLILPGEYCGLFNKGECVTIEPDTYLVVNWSRDNPNIPMYLRGLHPLLVYLWVFDKLLSTADFKDTILEHLPLYWIKILYLGIICYWLRTLILWPFIRVSIIMITLVLKHSFNVLKYIFRKKRWERLKFQEPSTIKLWLYFAITINNLSMLRCYFEWLLVTEIHLNVKLVIEECSACFDYKLITQHLSPFDPLQLLRACINFYNDNLFTICTHICNFILQSFDEYWCNICDIVENNWLVTTFKLDPNVVYYMYIISHILFLILSIIHSIKVTDYLLESVIYFISLLLTDLNWIHRGDLIFDQKYQFELELSNLNDAINKLDKLIIETNEKSQLHVSNAKIIFKKIDDLDHNWQAKGYSWSSTAVRMFWLKRRASSTMSKSIKLDQYGEKLQKKKQQIQKEISQITIDVAEFDKLGKQLKSKP